MYSRLRMWRFIGRCTNVHTDEMGHLNYPLHPGCVYLEKLNFENDMEFEDVKQEWVCNTYDRTQ